VDASTGKSGRHACSAHLKPTKTRATAIDSPRALALGGWHHLFYLFYQVEIRWAPNFFRKIPLPHCRCARAYCRAILAIIWLHQLLRLLAEINNLRFCLKSLGRQFRHGNGPGSPIGPVRR
jgi:hypothetical protein